MATRAIGELAFYYGDKINTGEYDNGIWMDILDIPYIQKIEEASLYKTVIRTLWIEATGWSKEIKSRWPHIKIIGLSDHPLSAHISRLSADRQYAYIKDLEYLDGIMALTEEERQWYQIAVPSKPVIKVGLPFPVETYEKRYGALRNVERDIVGLGVGASDNDRNFITNLLVFDRLRVDYPDLRGVFLSIPRPLLPYCAYLADQYPNVFIHERKETNEYMEMLARCKFVLSLADRNSPGRLQGEAAFLEIPVVGSNRLELQNELWPEYSVAPFCAEEAFDAARSILEEPALAKGIAKTAHKALIEIYNYEQSKKVFDKLLAKIQEG